VVVMMKTRKTWKTHSII